jgi:hypothetical protein
VARQRLFACPKGGKWTETQRHSHKFAANPGRHVFSWVLTSTGGFSPDVPADHLFTPNQLGQQSISAPNRYKNDVNCWASCSATLIIDENINKTFVFIELNVLPLHQCNWFKLISNYFNTMENPIYVKVSLVNTDMGASHSAWVNSNIPLSKTILNEKLDEYQYSFWNILDRGRSLVGWKSEERAKQCW